MGGGAIYQALPASAGPDENRVTQPTEYSRSTKRNAV